MRNAASVIPLLAGVALLLALPVRAAGAPATFEDVAARAGLRFVHTAGDSRVDSAVEAAGAGCGWLDYDGDGWLDAYLVNGAWTPGVSDPEDPRRAALARATNRLFRNNGDGTFADVTAAAGVGDGGYGVGMAAADHDNDGDVDLYVTNYGPNVLYRNEGDGTFTDVSARAGVADAGWGTGAAFLDHDRDGDLDLFVGNCAARGAGLPPGADGRSLVLFRNDGDGSFADVTETALGGVPAGCAMGVSVADLDGDGWPDLFVSRRGAMNLLFLNRGDGTFIERALVAGLGYGPQGAPSAATGVAVADMDGDGRLDVFTAAVRRPTFYRGVGGGLFEELTAPAGLADGLAHRSGWGVTGADFDNDGDVDLYQATGGAGPEDGEDDVLFENLGGARFADAPAPAAAGRAPRRTARGVAPADFDHDGDIDLLVQHLDGPAALLRNRGEGRGHWLQLTLRGTKSARDGAGATVHVTAGGRTQLRVALDGTGYLAQPGPRLHFGLGPAALAERVVIRWPTGAVQTLTDVPADQILLVTERPARTAERGQPGALRPAQSAAGRLIRASRLALVRGAVSLPAAL